MGSGSSISADASEPMMNYQLEKITTPNVIEYLVSLNPDFGPYRRLFSYKSLDAKTLDALPHAEENVMDFVSSLGEALVRYHTLFDRII